MAQAMARQRGRGEPGGVRWLALGGALLVVIVLTFAAGILVGRLWSHPAGPGVSAGDPARKPAATPRRSGLAELPHERPPQEKLTFYQTLTAPLGTPPAAPAAVKAPLPPKPEAPKARPAQDRLAEPPAAAAPDPAARAEKAPAPAPERPPGPRSADDRRGDWAVQVGAFRDRDQAERVRKPLAASGLDAYVIAAAADDGQMRFKVRLGGFKTREDASRMADRLRQERSLTAFVTQR